MLASRKLRIAVPTGEVGDLEDIVSEVFGRAETFTIIDIQEEMENVEVLRNPVLSYKQGAGPIVVEMLMDSGVNVVISGELGSGASTLLKQNHVRKVVVKPGTSVAEAINDFTNLKVK